MSVIMLPGSTSAELNLKEYARKIEPALYNAMSIVPKLSERAEKIKNGLFVRRLNAVSAQVLAATNDGTTFNFSDFNPQQYELTPNWLIAAGAYTTAGPRRQGPEIETAFMDNLRDCMGAALDTIVGAEFSVATATPLGGPAYDIEAIGLRTTMAALMTATKMGIESGKTKIHLVLSTAQLAALMAVPEITQAQQRGDGASPNATGRLSNGLGYSYDFTTLLTTDVNGVHGAAFHSEAIHYGYNLRPKPDKQNYLKQIRLMVEAEIGFETIFQEKIRPIRTQN